eukprot:134244_1
MSITNMLLPIFLLFISIINAAPSSGCGKKQPDDNGSTKEYFFPNQNYNRTYIVHIPTRYSQNNSTGQPLFLGLHGYTNTANSFSTTFGMIPQSNQENYLAVFFQATYFDSKAWGPVSSWNDGDCGKSPGPEGPTCNPYSVQPVPRPPACADPDGNQCNWCNCLVDDVAAIQQLITILEGIYCIDTSREYITGFSQGSMLVHRVACELPQIFAAAAPFHGQQHLGFDCEPSTSVTMPLMNVWGTSDTEVPGQNVLSGDGWYYIPVSNVQEKFAVHNGCNLKGGVQPIKTVSDGIESWKCVTWNVSCTDNAYTQSCSWRGTHTYPVQGKTYFGLNVAWNFVKQFTRKK